MQVQPTNSTSSLEFINYLANHPHITELHQILNHPSFSSFQQTREQLFKWTIDLCTSLNISASTCLSACNYLDLFFHSNLNNDIPNSFFQALSTASVFIASKFAKEKGISLESFDSYLKLSKDILLTTEKYVLQTIKWKLVVVTLIDLVRAIIDFTLEANEEIENIAFFFACRVYCYREICKEGVVACSVACVLAALKVKGVNLEDWKKEVEMVLVDWNVVCNVLRKIEEKIEYW